MLDPALLDVTLQFVDNMLRSPVYDTSILELDEEVVSVRWA